MVVLINCSNGYCAKVIVQCKEIKCIRYCTIERGMLVNIICTLGPWHVTLQTWNRHAFFFLIFKGWWWGGRCVRIVGKYVQFKTRSDEDLRVPCTLSTLAVVINLSLFIRVYTGTCQHGQHTFRPPIDMN